MSQSSLTVAMKRRTAPSKSPTDAAEEPPAEKKAKVEVEQKPKVQVDAKAIQDLLGCEVCHDRLRSPVRQCHNGHMLCPACYAEIAEPAAERRNGPGHCPTCRQLLPGLSIRTLAIDKLLEILELPCRHEPCPYIPKPAERTTHEDACGYRPIICDWGQEVKDGQGACKWTGTLNESFEHTIKGHLLERESKIKPGKKGQLRFYDTRPDEHGVELMSCVVLPDSTTLAVHFAIMQRDAFYWISAQEAAIASGVSLTIAMHSPTGVQLSISHVRPVPWGQKVITTGCGDVLCIPVDRLPAFRWPAIKDATAPYFKFEIEVHLPVKDDGKAAKA